MTDTKKATKVIIAEYKSTLLEKVRKIMEGTEATQVVVPDKHYKKGWHWKSLGDAYIRNKLRKELLDQIESIIGEI